MSRINLKQDDWLLFSVDTKPDYYSLVECTDGCEIFTCWLAVSDNGDFIWTLDKSDRIISGISHWRKIKT